MSQKQSFKPGELIHQRYRVLNALGEGSMGEVLLVYDLHIDRPVAMKLLKTEILSKEEHLLRFIDEAKCQARLQHPGVISVYDIGLAENGQLFFTMRAVQGLDFSHLIKQIHQLTYEQGLWGVSDQGWSFRRLIQALKQCADAVGFAHEQGIIHRDLKPHNLIIGPHGDPLVLDWGIAKYLGTEFKPSSTEQLQFYVTPTPTPVKLDPLEEDDESMSETIDLKQLGFDDQDLLSNSLLDQIDVTPLMHTSDSASKAFESLRSGESVIDKEDKHLVSKTENETSTSSSLQTWLSKTFGTEKTSSSFNSVFDDLKNTYRTGSFKSVSTLAGTITGTPAYMSPEQAKGQSADVNPSTDVYALGCILYHILTGVPPYRGQKVANVLEKVKSGNFPVLIHQPRESLPSSNVIDHEKNEELESIQTVAPEALIRICQRAMSYEHKDRYSNASEFASALGEWINGVQQRQEALDLLAKLNPIRHQQEILAKEATELDLQAKKELKKLPSWASEYEKSPFWELEDQANNQRKLIEDLDFQVESKLQTARSLAGDLVELHQEACDHYMSLHKRLITARRSQEAHRALAHLEDHAHLLPIDHPSKEIYLSYLRGESEIVLKIVNNFDEITVYPEKLSLRYLTLGEKLEGDKLKVTSISKNISTLKAELKNGSYILFLSKNGQKICYPFESNPREIWTTVPPEPRPSSESQPLVVPPPHALGQEDSLIIGGWCRCGDLEAPRAVPPIKVWVDSFVVQTHPVTHEQYLIFLNDLFNQGQIDKALKHTPQEMSTSGDSLLALLYTYNENMGFSLPQNAQELGWFPQSPVVMVNWWDACAYAEWYAEHTQKPWRLLSEWEWEKAARGVDGRAYPWGNYIDPSWCCNRLSHKEKPGTQPVGTFPIDRSPYGVMGMAGNTADWTLTPHEDEPEIIDGTYAPKPDLNQAMNTDLPARVAKGGAWDDGPAFCHTAVRHRGGANYRRHSLSFRIGYSITKEEEAKWANS